MAAAETGEAMRFDLIPYLVVPWLIGGLIAVSVAIYMVYG